LRLSATEAVLRPEIDLLDAVSRAAFDGPEASQRGIPAGARVLTGGKVPSSVEVIRSGWAANYRSLKDGRRQLLSFLLPGDLICAAEFADATVETEAITELRLQSSGVRNLTVVELHPVVAVQTLRMQEMLLSLGQRDAVERTAALLLDLFDRAVARQMVHTDTFVIPLAQKHLSAALGISPVHTSRVMNILKTAGMVELGHGKLEVSIVSQGVV